MKRTIYIIIIVITLGGALVMGYMAFFSGGSTETAPTTDATQATAENYKILPYGSDLDFTGLKEYNKTKTVFPYPKVDKQEIGKVLGQILE